MSTAIVAILRPLVDPETSFDQLTHIAIELSLHDRACLPLYKAQNIVHKYGSFVHTNTVCQRKTTTTKVSVAIVFKKKGPDSH